MAENGIYLSAVQEAILPGGGGGNIHLRMYGKFKEWLYITMHGPLSL